MNSLHKALVSALDRQYELRATGGSFDERARLQSHIHDLRARLAAQARASHRF